MGNRVCEKAAVEEEGWMTSFPISLAAVSSASWVDRVGAGTEGGGEGKIWSTPSSKSNHKTYTFKEMCVEMLFSAVL